MGYCCCLKGSAVSGCVCSIVRAGGKVTGKIAKASSIIGRGIMSVTVGLFGKEV